MAGERAPQPSGGQGGRCLWMPHCRNANCSLGLGGGVGHICLYLPPSPCLFSVLSSSCAPSPLFLSHLDSHLLSPFSSLPPIALCFKVSKPGCFFKGGPLTISPAGSHSPNPGGSILELLVKSQRGSPEESCSSVDQPQQPEVGSVGTVIGSAVLQPERRIAVSDNPLLGTVTGVREEQVNDTLLALIY